MIHTFLMNFLISLKLLQASQTSITQGMLHGLLFHSAVFICSACHSFPSAWSFYVRNPRDSLLADQGSTSIRSHGTHGRLSDKETVNAGPNSCGKLNITLFMLYYSTSLLFSSGKGVKTNNGNLPPFHVEMNLLLQCCCSVFVKV